MRPKQSVKKLCANNRKIQNDRDLKELKKHACISLT